MRQYHPSCPLPSQWLVSDARNDAVLDRALARMPRGSGFIFRHYHLVPAERQGRFDALARIACKRGVLVVLAGSAALARAWGADGAYGQAHRLGRGKGLRLATAHSLSEIGAANRAGVDMILLSPAFATRSHPGAMARGPVLWRLLAARAQAPVIALGGMNARKALHLGVRRWAAIDGLSMAARTLSTAVRTGILDASAPSGALYSPQQGT